MAGNFQNNLEFLTKQVLLSSGDLPLGRESGPDAIARGFCSGQEARDRASSKSLRPRIVDWILSTHPTHILK